MAMHARVPQTAVATQVVGKIRCGVWSCAMAVAEVEYCLHHQLRHMIFGIIRYLQQLVASFYHSRGTKFKSSCTS